jgi:NADPH:quinone reductase
MTITPDGHTPETQDRERITATAARLHAHKEPLRIESTSIDCPGRDEVLVEMAFGGLNPVDRYGILGLSAADGPLPRTMGTEGSGTVDGNPVIVHGAGVGTRRDGVWATAAVVPSGAVTRVPDGVTLEQAATLGVAGATAWRVVKEVGRPSSEDRVLVLGASGGVGSMIVSLLRSAGAPVWGQTESESNREWITALGAGNVVVCDADGLEDAVDQLSPTLVFDPLGGGFTGASISAMAENGRIVIFGTSAGTTGEVPLQLIYRKNLTIHGYAGLIASPESIAEAKRNVLVAVATGEMQVPIGATFPLAEANDALEALTGRSVRGKILLDLHP